MSVRMQTRCEVYMDSYMASNGSCFVVTWSLFKSFLLRVGLTKPLGDHGIPNAQHRDRFTSSTLSGRKGRASPSSLHITLEGPTELCECKTDVKSTWIPTWQRMDHVSWLLGLFEKPTSWR